MIHRIPAKTTHSITLDRSQSCRAAHENIVFINIEETVPPSYCYEPIVHVGTTHEASRRVAMSMKMVPGALPRPDRVPEQELLSPELGFSMAAELRCISGKMVGGSSVFRVLGIL